MLRREVASQAEALGAAGETIAQLQAQVRNAAAPAVLQALEDLTIAYRGLASLDGNLAAQHLELDADAVDRGIERQGVRAAACG
jgi:hypothetical protein